MNNEMKRAIMADWTTGWSEPSSSTKQEMGMSHEIRESSAGRRDMSGELGNRADRARVLDGATKESEPHEAIGRGAGVRQIGGTEYIYRSSA